MCLRNRRLAFDCRPAHGGAWCLQVRQTERARYGIRNPNEPPRKARRAVLRRSSRSSWNCSARRWRRATRAAAILLAMVRALGPRGHDRHAHLVEMRIGDDGEPERVPQRFVLASAASPYIVSRSEVVRGAGVDDDHVPGLRLHPCGRRGDETPPVCSLGLTCRACGRRGRARIGGAPTRDPGLWRTIARGYGQPHPRVRLAARVERRCELAPGADRELAVDVREAHLDRLHGHEERLGDLLVEPRRGCAVCKLRPFPPSVSRARHACSPAAWRRRGRRAHARAGSAPAKRRRCRPLRAGGLEEEEEVHGHRELVRQAGARERVTARRGLDGLAERRLRLLVGVAAAHESRDRVVRERPGGESASRPVVGAPSAAPTRGPAPAAASRPSPGRARLRAGVPDSRASAATACPPSGRRRS